VAPTLPPLTAQIRRGTGPQQMGCAQSASSCDDIGSVSFQAGATDDVTPPEHIGYRFTLEAGALPAGLTLPGAVEPFAAQLTLLWIDGATNDQESIDFTLRVVAIDAAGNESAAQTVRVSDDAGGACAVAGARPPRLPFAGFVGLALTAVLLVRRRRPARIRQPQRRA
jgi:hypothetical protein